MNPANTVDFEINFKTDVNRISVSNKTGYHTFFGAKNSDINRIISITFEETGSHTIFIWKNNTSANGASSIVFNTYSTYNPQNKITISCINDEWNVNGDKVGASESVGTWNDVNNTLVIFGSSRISNSQKNITPLYENMYLYSLKIWDNETLIRDFIPVVSQESGHENEACLYDLVNGEFYYNNGTGNFETN